jgi:hypothetical protein
VLPSWLNVENLQILALIITVVAIGLGLLAVISIKTPGMRAGLIILCFLVGISAFIYRQNLDDCKPSCSCTLGDMVVPDSGCPGS